MISEKLKQVIFKELYHQLGKVEIIPYRDSIFFINRENKYWYFEFEKNGRLWWRYDFFSDFFELFPLGVEDYRKIISEWVEEVLNCKVLTTGMAKGISRIQVEEVLNCKVSTTSMFEIDNDNSVEEVLNCKVTATDLSTNQNFCIVEEVLNCKVSTMNPNTYDASQLVEEVLSHTNK